MAGIESDRNALVGSTLFDNIVSKSLGRAADCIDIHTVDSGSNDSAKSRSTKFQIHMVDLHVILHVLTPLMHYFPGRKI